MAHTMADPRSHTTPGTVTLSPAGADGIARVCIDNPAKLNVLSVVMWQELRAAFERVDDGRARVVIVHGEGSAFAAGGDIEEFPSFRFDEAALRGFHEDTVAPALQQVLGCDLPVLAQIVGPCIGGGLEIASCCDIRIAGAGSRFGVPIAKLGFPIAPIEAQIVARVMPLPVLRQLLIEGCLFDAVQAHAHGFVQHLLPDREVASFTTQLAQRIATLSPQALRLNKITLRQIDRGGPTEQERAAHYHYADSAEHREGLAAFIAKRPARFHP